MEKWIYQSKLNLNLKVILESFQEFGADTYKD